MTPDKERHTILTCYYRPKPGGYCKRLFRAINALLKRGHTVHYLAVVPFPISHPNCHFHRFPWPESCTRGYLFWGFFHFFAPFQLLYLGFRYKVGRTFVFGYSYSLFMQPLRIIKHIPVTLFLRADNIENHRILKSPNWHIRLELVMEGLGIAGTKLYGVSEVLTRRTVARHSFFSPTLSGVLRNDITLQPKRTQVPKKAQTPMRLACVGVLEPRKNQRFLLEIMRKVDVETAHLYLYGTGPDEEILRKIVKEKKLEDRVHFMGWIAAEQIWPEIDLLLMPSLHEGAPNAVLEALGNRVPVLASDIPEHRELLEQTSLIDTNSSDILVNTIESMIKEDKLYEKLISPKSTVDNLVFDWNGYITKKILAI